MRTLDVALEELEKKPLMVVSNGSKESCCLILGCQSHGWKSSLSFTSGSFPWVQLYMKWKTTPFVLCCFVLDKGLI